ncbi:protocadherin Fat 4-like [Ylistrum balloti]|uniref:protocadherin Fat 4-like n=1 Tax=Ylistrum balloti TaxID=509963 RepID=UPI002905B81F|nr:protocadherin Fat 4-like [Ylistrum balloti]
MPGQTNDWTCRCIPGYVEKGQTCTKLPGGIFNDNEMYSVIPSNASKGHTVLRTNFSKILDICTTNPEITMFGDADLFEAVVSSCRTLTIRTTSVLPGDTSVRKLMVKAKFETGINVIMDAIFLTVTIQRTEGNTVVLPDMTFSDHLVTSVAPGGKLSLSNSNFLRITSDGSVFTAKQLSVDGLTSNDTEVATFFTTDIQRHDGTSTTSTILTTVLLKTNVMKKLSEVVPNNAVVASFNRLHQSTLTFSATSNINSNIFAFDGSVLKVQNAVLLDYDNGQRSFTFVINVRITVDSDVMTVPVTVEIEVQPANDNSPYFVKDREQRTDKYEFTIFPTPLSSVVCGSVRAKDVDAGTQLTYLLDQPSAYFTIGQHDGIVKTQQSTSSIPFVNGTEKSGELYVTFGVLVRDEISIHTDTANVTVYLRKTPERNLGLQFNADISEDASLNAVVRSVFRTGYTNYEFASRTVSTEFFTINFDTGRVSVSRTLDREIQDTFKFSVTAIEEKSASCALVVLGDLNITVTDVNDNPPVFGRPSYNGEVEENATSNSLVKLDFPIKATDKDIGNFTYRITQRSTFFSISQSGVISTRQILDRETTSSYAVVVTADDGLFTSTTTVTVTVTDLNDNDPAFPSPTYRVDISEGKTAPKLITTSATDADTGSNGDLSYFLNGGGDNIVIGYNTSVISVINALDREEKSSYTLIVTVIDGGDPPRSSSTTVVVDVLDVNDNDPVFLDTSLVITIKEEVSCTNGIGQISATDRDSSDILRYNTSDTRFTVDPNSGEVRCKERLDFEVTQRYSLAVTVRDTGLSPRQTDATVIINLEDINDNSPNITHPETVSLQQKDFAISRPLMVVDVDDRDSGRNGEVTFSLTLTDLVTIDDNGIIKTVQKVNVPLPGTYTTTVVVTDRGVPPRSVSSTITIQVTVDTDIDLKFRIQQHKFTVLEEESSGTMVGDVSLNLDNPKGLQARYDIPDSSDLFAIDSTSGNITTRKALDREIDDEYVVFVRVRADGAETGDLTLVNVTLTDKNDHPPVFPRDKYRLVAREDLAIGYVIITVSVTDEDVGVNERNFFSLRNSSSSECWQDFHVDNMTGQLKVVKSLDYETYTACQYTLLAFDISPAPLTSSIEVYVTITDVNDNSPTFSASTYLLEVAENFRSETSVFGTVSDADSNENGRIQLSDGSPSTCPFRIKTGTKSLIMTLSGLMTLDYENETSYSCVIVATDMAKETPRSSSAYVTVSITDVNDNAPVFDQSSYEVNISRDLSTGSEVIKVMATDADSGFNKQIRYILAAGDEGYMQISPTSGRVTVSKPLYDYRRDTMEINVIAIDQLPGAAVRLSSSVTLVINIEDANVRPNFPESTVYKELREETEVTGVFYTVSANDWDGTANRKCSCTYRLENPSSVFEIHNETGEIRMKAGTSVDRERDGPSVSIGIIARDQGSPPKDSETLSLNITVLDINDQSPRFRYQTIPTFKIYQTHPSGSAIGDVIAEDMDGSEFNMILYSVTDLFYSETATFSDRNTSIFGQSTIVVDSTNGTLRTTRGLELLGQTSTFYIMLNVEAVDKGDTSMKDSTPAIVEVKYEDTNMHYPRFSQDLYRKEIRRSHSLDEVIVTVSATDADAAPKNAITYSIIAGNYRDVMTIDSTNGNINLAYLIDEKFDVSNLTLTVRATDRGDKPKHSTSIVIITLSGQYQVCFTADMRTEIVAEKDLFFAVMIGLVAALCIAIGLCFFLFYKYRTMNVPKVKTKEFDYDQLSRASQRQDHDYTVSPSSMETSETNGANRHYMSFRDGNAQFSPPADSTYHDISDVQPSVVSHINPGFDASGVDVQ